MTIHNHEILDKKHSLKKNTFSQMTFREISRFKSTGKDTIFVSYSSVRPYRFNIN